MGQDAAALSAQPAKRRTNVGRFDLAFLFLFISAAVIVGGLMFSRDEKGMPSPVVSSPTEEEFDGKCFETREELLMAVGDYLGGDKRAQVVQVYGPIANWCVGQLTDFTAIFRDQKEFNEKLDGWDLSQAKTLREMFSGCTSFSQDLNWDVSNVEVSRDNDDLTLHVSSQYSILTFLDSLPQP
jgi:hypothetical protein